MNNLEAAIFDIIYLDLSVYLTLCASIILKAVLFLILADQDINQHEIYGSADVK